MTYTAQSTPVVNAIYPSITGATVINGTNTTIAVTSGLMRDQSDTYDINIGNFGGQYSYVSANSDTVIDTAFVGVNGIDTGVLEASKLYYVYVIADTSLKNIPAAMVSLASPATSPVMPFGYDIYRVVGFARTNSSSHFNKHYVYGDGNARYMAYTSPLSVVSSGSATTSTSIALQGVVPAQENLPVTFEVSYVPATAGNTVNFLVPGTGTNQVTITGQVASVALTQQVKGVATLISGLPVYNYLVSNASDEVSVGVYGFNFTV